MIELLNSTLTNHDDLAYIFTPMMNFLRTIFTVYANRGLLDAIPLPRTTPDKHENYHQCVPSSGCYVIPVGWTF